MDSVSMFLTAQRAFQDRVHAVGDAQWHLPTPCRDWDVATLVTHVIDENRWAAPLMHGLDLESAEKVVKGSRSLPVDGGVGANLAAEWDEAAVAAADAFAADGALERNVSLSRGSTPARDYLHEMIFDHVVHGWDLGKAIGFDEPLPEDAVAAVYEIVKAFGDLEVTGAFDPPVEVAADAPTVDKLVALTGRNPR